MSDIQRLAAGRRKFIAWVAGIAAALAAIHVALQLLRFIGHHDYVWGLTPLFDLDLEGNIPTLFQTLLLLACAGLLAHIATVERQRGGRHAWPWTILATGFLFMAVDEFAKIHELVDAPMQALLGDRASGWLLYTWVVPYALIVLGLGLYFLRFLRDLPRATAIRFVVAGAVYVGAALGIEFLEGAHAQVHGEQSAGYVVLTTIQEILEMTGLVLFMDALLRHIHEHGIAFAPVAPRAAGTG